MIAILWTFCFCRVIPGITWTTMVGQLQAWRGDAPSLYDISGSAHFVNKCDVGLVVHRNRDADKGPIDQVQVFVWYLRSKMNNFFWPNENLTFMWRCMHILQIIVRKVRNKAAGTVGDVILDYDRYTTCILRLEPVK